MVGCKYSLTHNPLLTDVVRLICRADMECLHEYNTCCLIMCVCSEAAHLSTCLLRNMSINFLLSIMEIDETIERERDSLILPPLLIEESSAAQQLDI